EKFAKTASMYNRVVDSSLLKQPKEYRGEFNAQKVKEWVTTMEIFMEAKGEPRENWVTQAGTYFRDYALTWYTQLWQKHLDDNTILTWKELTDKLTVELVPDNPATLARRKMRKLEYRGNILAHIEIFRNLSLEIPNMSLPEAFFNFAESLPDKLGLKLFEKEKSIVDMRQMFEETNKLVASKPKLGKVKKWKPKEGDSKGHDGQTSKQLGNSYSRNKQSWNSDSKGSNNNQQGQRKGGHFAKK
ncbi:hypothetical protein WAH74_19610, partial [Acinetobacter baumannii]